MSILDWVTVFNLIRLLFSNYTAMTLALQNGLLTIEEYETRIIEMSGIYSVALENITTHSMAVL